MDVKYIVVEGVTAYNIERILRDLAELYAETGFADGIRLYKNCKKENSFFIRFRKTPDFDRFSYFVNYLVYPAGQKQQTMKVIGYSKLNLCLKNIKYKKGEWIMYYIPSDDTQYDNVDIVTERNLHYRFHFGRKIIRLNETEQAFYQVKYTHEDYIHLMDIYPTPKLPEKKSNPWWKFWK